MSTTRKLLLRASAVALALFGIAFGGTWSQTGYCLGDQILTAIGLPAWSDGTQGTHYSAIYGALMLFVAMYLFASTTEDAMRTVKLLFWIAVAVLVALSLSVVLL